MKKVLFVATIAEHFYYFHLPYFKMFHDIGWKVHVACSGEMELENCDKLFNLPIQRSPFSFSNIKSYKMLKKIINDNHYDIIHCHTPVGGILARLAAGEQRKKSTKVIYTAHGFHFYKGAPLLNWLLYFPIEYIMSKKTDCLITINEEDYKIAKKMLKAKRVELVNGVGYNTQKFYSISLEEKNELKCSYNCNKNETILIYVAEMNKNKNQGMLIKAVKILKEKGFNIKLLIVGSDNYNKKYISLAENSGVSQNIDFLGHREDTDKLLHISDICVASSIREGLPVNIMEALACGLPVVCSSNRGHRVLIKEDYNGYLIPIDDSELMAVRIEELIINKELYNKVSENAIDSVKPFSKESVVKEMEKIYKSVL